MEHCQEDEMRELWPCVRHEHLRCPYNAEHPDGGRERQERPSIAPRSFIISLIAYLRRSSKARSDSPVKELSDDTDTSSEGSGSENEAKLEKTLEKQDKIATAIDA
ncbi:hypothetical protein DdX_21447 [Ditylenchus destructor]|uniref:Uncharacterized protein n=1 Tax=Ditylenchus destructor TaxID=166010 RepID=A0AAD4MGG8_9BILA|nr:hypothetical protein DdX_21447 [Ditylenchus destructor]